MKLKDWTKNTTLKYLVHACVVEKLQNRKLESLKSFKVKRGHEATCTSSRFSRFDQKKLICKATANNNIQSQKYGYPPKVIKENAKRSEKFREIYDF